jgi:glycosyltransferase involved in cell wall biosynthesis
VIEGISFVIPAYNEEENVAAVVAACQFIAPRVSRNHEIIVVNDGSTDRTRAIVEALGANDPGVLLINHPNNRGIAAAVRQGFAAARYPYIFYTDGDGQFDLNDINALLPYCRDFDFVIGYRLNRADPRRRKIAAFFYNLVIRWLFPIKVRDVDCAFKLIKRESLAQLRVRADSAFYFAELLIRAARSGMAIREVPVHHYPRSFGQPTGDKMGVVLKALRDLALYLLIEHKRTPRQAKPRGGPGRLS